MITSFNQYIEGVLISESAEQTGWRAEIPTAIYRGNHSIYGFMTELGEICEAITEPADTIDWVNIKEELGDAWWYFGPLIDALQLRGQVQIVPQGFADRTLEEQVACLKELAIRFMAVLGRMTDPFKRRIYYFAEELPDGHQKKEKAKWSHVIVGMTELATILSHMTAAAGFDVRDVWTANLLKLIGPNGRYAGKFDADKALFRDLVSERKVLEGGEEVSDARG